MGPCSSSSPHPSRTHRTSSSAGCTATSTPRCRRHRRSSAMASASTRRPGREPGRRSVGRTAWLRPQRACLRRYGHGKRRHRRSCEDACIRCGVPASTRRELDPDRDLLRRLPRRHGTRQALAGNRPASRVPTHRLRGLGRRCIVRLGEVCAQCMRGTRDSPSPLCRFAAWEATCEPNRTRLSSPSSPHSFTRVRTPRRSTATMQTMSRTSRR